MKRAMLLLSMMIALAGCGGGSHVAYRPIAFGENNQCYYVNSPAETQMLMDRGLCDRGWAPTIMPSYWHSMYYPYYSSPAYYRTYVPVGVRTVYVNSEKTWGSSNKTMIAEKAKAAQYQGSNGKTVSADKIGATKYGAGNRFGPAGTKFGGGNRNPITTPASGLPKVDATPTKPGPAVKTAPSPKAPKSPTPAPKPRSSSGTKSGGGSKSYGGGGGSKSYGGGRR
jgi:hypothetical protein